MCTREQEGTSQREEGRGRMGEGKGKGKGVTGGREEEKDSRRQGRDGKGGTRKCKSQKWKEE